MQVGVGRGEETCSPLGVGVDGQMLYPNGLGAGRVWYRKVRVRLIMPK